MADDAVEDLGIEGLTGAIEVGVGGFATVFRADQPAFRRTVAVKVLATSTLDDESRERFERECQAMGLLSDHPNIVTVYGAGFTAGSQRPYLVMAYLPGGSLAERIERDGPLPWQDATLYGVHLAGALETAHRADVVHRDIKPANVLMSTFGDAQLTDFGIARISGGHETRSGVITASMHHAPPEVLDGQRPTRAGDVYSLGSTIFELVAGRPAFEGDEDDGSMVPMLRRILTDPPPDLRTRGVPDAVATVIERSMAKDPLARQQSALELGREMQAARRSVGLEGGKLTVPSDLAEEAADATGMAFVAAPSQVLCPSCHAELVPGATHCGSCGTPVGGVTGPQPPPSGPATPAPAPAAAPTGGQRRSLVGVLVVVGIILLGAAIGGAFALTRSSDDVAGPAGSTVTTEGSTTSTTDAPGSTTTALEGDYTAEVEQNFINSCVQGGGATRSLCRCIFTSIRQDIPYERFIELEVELRRGQSLAGTELEPLVLACVEQEGQTGPSLPS